MRIDDAKHHNEYITIFLLTSHHFRVLNQFQLSSIKTFKKRRQLTSLKNKSNQAIYLITCAFSLYRPNFFLSNHWKGGE